MKANTTKQSTGKVTSKQIYKNIDELPIYNYKKIIETKDLTHLLKDEKTEVEPAELESIWAAITEQLSEFSGVNDQYQKWLLLHIDLENLQLDYLATNDRALITQINIKIKQIERMAKQFEGSGGDFDKQIAAVELYFKFHIDERSTTVKRFFNYINLMKAGNGRR